MTEVNIQTVKQGGIPLIEANEWFVKKLNTLIELTGKRAFLECVTIISR